MKSNISYRASSVKKLHSHNIILPFLNNFQKPDSNFNIKQYRNKKDLRYSANQTKKFKLDLEKYKTSISMKKDQIFSLEKKYEILKDKNKFNEVIQEIISKNNNKTSNSIINNNLNCNNNNNMIKSISKKNNESRVTNYKKNKKILEIVTNDYMTGKKEKKKIKEEI